MSNLPLFEQLTVSMDRLCDGIVGDVKAQDNGAGAGMMRHAQHP